MPKTSDKTVGRLSLYRRTLLNLQHKGVMHVHSGSLADMVGLNAAQVRRDLMEVGANGTPAKGYPIKQLLENLNQFFHVDEQQNMALTGVGNLGRALLDYFPAKRSNAKIQIAFDSDPHKTNRVIVGCRCYPAEEMEQRIREFNINLGIIAVPAEHAQKVADRFVAAGIRGILNFAPTALHVPSQTYLEDIDITMSLDKVIHFARA